MALTDAEIAKDLEVGDRRVEFMAVYILRNFKIKPDRWIKMYNNDENKYTVLDFFDKIDNSVIVFSITPQGALMVSYLYPTQMKTKCIWFAKKNKGVIPKDEIMRKVLMYGELSLLPMEQFSVALEEILFPVFSNEENQKDWPKVIANDLSRHISNLKNKTYVVTGQMKGKTQLPIPAGAERVSDKEIFMAERGESVDQAIIHSIESVVIDWSNQIHEVLKKDSSRPLLDGLNPGPSFEVDFWISKYGNLENIFEQLNDPKAKKMALLLEKTQSSYFPAFKELFRETYEALEEAADINAHLKPMTSHLELLENGDFAVIAKSFEIVFHCICLVWAHSKYYCRPPRLIVLLQELNNLIMKRTNLYLKPIELFKMEPEEAMEKIRKTFSTLETYLNTYEYHKKKILTYFKNGIPPKEWEFSRNLVFALWDKFMERMNMINDLFKTAIDFHRLEKVEIGGTKGKALTSSIVKILEEFKEEFDKFNTKKYDPLDTKCDEFFDDFKDFNKFVMDLDRRLLAIINRAFDDCNSLTSIYKLITILGCLLERKIIKEGFEPKYAYIVKFLEDEMDYTKQIYDEQISIYETKNEVIVHRNMPEVSGAVKWCQELKLRVIKAVDNFKKAIEHPIVHSEAMIRTENKQKELLTLLEVFSQKIYAEWCLHVAQLSDNNLEKNLIYRDFKTKSIKTNFDPQLVSVLKEVKYFKMLEIENIPEEAIKIFDQNNQYRSFITSLDYTVDSYNKILRLASVEERPLIQNEIDLIDAQLENGEKNLKWKSPNINEYISGNQNGVSDLEKRLQKSKLNLERIKKLMNTWTNNPLFKRCDFYATKSTLLQLDDKPLRLETRYKEISDTGLQIHQIVEENKILLKVEDEDSKMWKAYTLCVDKMIVEGFNTIIQTSLNYFLKETDHIKFEPDPLFEIQLRLDPPELLFTPSMEIEEPESFYLIIQDLIQSVYKQASLIQRIAKHIGANDYQREMESKSELNLLKNEFMDRVNLILKNSNSYKSSFNKYASLWVDDRKDFMRQFLLYNHVLTPEEIEAHAETGGVPESPPTMDQFKEQVSVYEKIYEEACKLEDVRIIDKWFKIDSKPFKSVLLNTIKKWSYMFKQYLIDDVNDSLRDLDLFIRDKEKTLIRDVRKGDYLNLVFMMGQLASVREKTSFYDNMFDPIKNKIELLKSYGQEVSDDVYERLNRLPEKWNDVKKLAMQAKQKVAPLQADEVNNIRKKIASFEVEQFNFREAFKQEAPFIYGSKDPYELLYKSQEKLVEIEQSMAKLDESAQLFELQVPDFKQIKVCRKEIKVLKALWDYISIVCSTFEDWKQTLWKEINAESMDADCKKFAKEIRSLDKEMRVWDAYNGMDNEIKNMMTALRAVTELQNPTIRDRHWKELFTATGANFTMSEQTTFADLLGLNLHKFEDEVKGIVDKAVKESAMEKIIRDLDVTWNTMKFDTEPHLRTKQSLLQPSDELVETLEDNQVQLQNMLSSKYIAFFSVEVSAWQKKLSQADQVLTIMLEVQRTWSHLESIFVGSEDIRNQLPEDSKRFDKIDKEFGKICEENVQDLNVIVCTNRSGLFERLEVLEEDLALCEKALAEYLETKRLAFPRFYFVSSADLLDILSNGNEPEKVTKHLTKLFDSMAKIKMDKDNNSMAICMQSKDGEVVPFPTPLDLSGQVEGWLNRLLDAQCNTIQHWMGDAVQVYEEKSRQQWILEFPGQVALTGSQIWWTTEVNVAFSKLEEGFENALKDYYRKQVAQLNDLITLLLGDLTKGDRQKIMTICTIDVHARDVVTKMVSAKIENAGEFLWQCQLRHRWDDDKKDCFANICDAQFKYAHEYLGNQPRLVITPLTDRCYITLTQSLHLIMGGAPSGPAGTGKTETTKDLGRALGFMVYVFNCSEQMDYRSCGNIYKGLSQTGAWGCFDEFNRILVEVLSVIAVQVKAIQDAIRDKKKIFYFMGEDIKINPTVGIFITMNPGYAGRAELPENLKALFRPCAMVVPDFDLISEIMLVAEGFTEARLLARKFITLYTLCKELLSKQDHYDWGLRAIKSVLVVAGSLRRGDRDRPEDQVLIRALRDFNTPKIVTDDLPIFLGLIGDLFPALDVPRKRDLEFEKLVKQATTDMKLQPEEGFILKVVQLQELFEVRHSVFIIGNAGTGKSQIWKTLIRTYQNQKKKTTAVDLNPKVVSNDELYGVINPTTREWKDGLFSVIMRDVANISHDGPKWIVLDGDIDPMWIESLNTVMDDNKVLTLASNERIPLTPTMRLLFEISHLRTATPATVSRAGILYINPGDLGWNPQVASWIDTREVQTEKANLTVLFDKYVPPCLEVIKSKFKKITPIVENSHINMLCYLLECLLTPQAIPLDASKEIYELYFVFCCVWSFGSALYNDQVHDYRVEFSKWWNSEFKAVKFPGSGNVFDYYIDTETKKFEPWTKLVEKHTFDTDIPLQSVLVSTNETTRLRFFIDLLVEKGRPIMLVGGAGTGKTVLMNDKLNALSDAWVVVNAPFNFYTTAEMLQSVLEKPLEKKAGRNYGPPGAKRLIYFIDDMNMPEVDEYGTVQPHTILRQYLDYKHWYDRQKLTLKEINACQYVSCMNPTAGSFTIDPRLQRHFAVFAVSFPSTEALQTIYNSILSQHLSSGFQPIVTKYSLNVVNLALAMHQRIAISFLPTAIKFHYVFNLRDLSNVFQGMLFARPDAIKTAQDLVRLYLHECERVYCDKLVDKTDHSTFTKIQREIVKKALEEFKEVYEEECFRKPNIFCHFAQGTGDPKYSQIGGWSQLNKILTDSLETYNELNATMNLVLFEDAMMNICRINRILESPRGNALLIGVGGSGKQSLSRLAASISSLEVFQITLTKGYSISDLKSDIYQLYVKAGTKNVGIVFLMTDAQVADEKFLVLINDLLASGEIPGLFPDDQIEEMIAAIRNEAKAQGVDDSRESCWRFFIDKVRRLLKVVLCFSPVGAALRVRSRKFPAVINCTSINWFHEWPEDALKSVAKRFLSEVDLLSPELQESIGEFMAFVHKSVNEMSDIYLQNDRRYNYTTPKSYLEQISLYKRLLQVKHQELQDKIVRLENGLIKLQSTAKQVDDLKEKLAVQEVEVKQKNEDADKLIKIVGEETEKCGQEKIIADEEQLRVSEISIEVGIKKEDCERNLVKALPALEAAQHALNTLDKNNLTEMKSFANPPSAVLLVASAVLVLLAPGGKVPKDRSWKAAKSMMGNVDKFLEQLKTYDKDNVPDSCRIAMQVYLKDPVFIPELVKTQSSAAAGLCSWCINILKYYEVYCDVAPKRAALSKANAELQSAKDKLAAVIKKVADLQEQLKELTDQFNEANAAKRKCEEDAQQTAYTINLANRLVGGLSSEKIRWTESVAQYRIQEKSLPGNVLLVTAFISYVGCFSKNYRVDLMDKFWMPYIHKLREKFEAEVSTKVPIPITNGLDILTLLIDDADIAEWNNEGLPGDRMSIENATILTSCDRWPLMIDPQLQGIKWIKNKYGENLKVIRLGQKNYLDKIEQAISGGYVLLIENIEESIEAVLDPLLGRNTIKKGKAIKIGDKEVEYHPNFKLILQTKLANPHYKPEMQAQTTLINFTVTRDGLEDQILADIVAKERPDLEKLKSELTKENNQYKITLKKLEDSLLAKLSSASGNFLGDIELVENLENTKATAMGIEDKVKEAKITSTKIDEAREFYRPAASRASLIYFIMNDLCKINPMYQFSLKAFKVVFSKAIERAEPADEIKHRVLNLIDSITFNVFIYTTRGLFEKHKLIFTSQMAFLILSVAKEIDPKELDFLLRFPVNPNAQSPVDFLTDYLWGGIKILSQLDDFTGLDRDIEGSAKRWKKFAEGECPEKEKFPQEWKSKTSLQKLCMLRALRPDRMLYALTLFVEEKLGRKYTENRSIEFSRSYEETTPSTPVFFILSPGLDPLKDVEKVGKTIGFTMDKKNFHNVSLGQGQEVVAEQAMEIAAKEGHWVVLQNIHLVSKWLSTLEKHMERHGENSHENFRMFVSADPATSPASHIIPQGILESAIKITNEPPTGMQANLHKAFDNFNQDTLEICSKEVEFKSILFSLCYFHAVVNERRKFGAQGWNKNYPFNTGDLNISVNVLYNYLEGSAKIPWENLRYLFGEIMYGGHITDDWDRRLCRCYLEEFMNQTMFDGELNLAPGFPVPPSSDYRTYHIYIDENLPPESPYLYGLHPNAEIDFLTTTSENLFRTVLELQPRDIGSGNNDEIGQTREEKVKQKLDDILDRLPDDFNIRELMTKAEEKTPYTIVAIQECERMNTLTEEIRRSLKELNLGLKGELTITPEMEGLQEALFFDTVPPTWTKRAYPSMYTLGQWYTDLVLRIKELENWTGDFVLPPAVWLGGLFNPQSFLTAIMQTTARRNEWPLDKMCISVEVTKKTKDDLGAAPREGAYTCGMFIEGARWDINNGVIAESNLKELTPLMPVIFVKAIPVDRKETKNIYDCPVYKTKSRGPTYVWTFNLKTKDKPGKWVLGGVAILLQV